MSNHSSTFVSVWIGSWFFILKPKFTFSATVNHSNKALFEWLTVAENVNFGLRMKNQDPIQTETKVEEWLDIVGLKGFGNTPTYQLSGGMQQRVALAKATLCCIPPDNW